MRTLMSKTADLLIALAMILATAIILTLVSCGEYDKVIPKGHHHEDQKTCVAQETEQGSTITCPDGSTATIKNGSSGPEGAPGAPGQDGKSGDAGAAGKDGAIGPSGPAGVDGMAGTAISELVPCPGIAGAYPETLLCIDGRLYAAYDGDPAAVHLTEVGPGNYRTTDGRVCYFTVVSGCVIR